MPYRIRKQPLQPLYKVYGKSGNPLSKKGLSLSKAKKQKIAATLSDLRQEGRIPTRRLILKKVL
jgi:hypothetical protein